MQVKVKLFAAARQQCSADEVAVDVDDRATVGELRAALARTYPALDAILAASMVAIDHDYAADHCEIRPGSDVALIPPVSGG